MVDGGRKVGIAGDVDLAPRALVAGGQPQQEPGSKLDRGGGSGVGPGRGDLTAVQDGERNRERENFEAGGLAGVPIEYATRPARAPQQVIDRGGGRASGIQDSWLRIQRKRKAGLGDRDSGLEFRSYESLASSPKSRLWIKIAVCRQLSNPSAR